MKFLITAAPDPSKPAAAPQIDDALFATYMSFNEKLQKAGVLVASEGLNPGKQGAQVVAKNGKRVLVDGPYAETKELVGGFWIVDVKDRAEAIEWALQAPTGLGSDDVLTIHTLVMGDDIPPELIAIAKRVAPTWFATLPKRGDA
jgi:hypothetical protein